MELIKSSEMKNAFVSLFNIYAHELSKYNPWLGTQINSEGNYLSEHVEKRYLKIKNLKAYPKEKTFFLLKMSFLFKLKKEGGKMK